MFKVNNRNTRRRCEICSKLTTFSSVSFVNFEQVNTGWEDILRVLIITELFTSRSRMGYNIWPEKSE